MESESLGLSMAVGEEGGGDPVPTITTPPGTTVRQQDSTARRHIKASCATAFGRFPCLVSPLTSHVPLCVMWW
jgi:hypothetical protein